MLDKCIGDPYTEVVMALHDALAFQNYWIDYTKKQYQGAYELFWTLDKQSHQTSNSTLVGASRHSYYPKTHEFLG